jgi:hypothetical protein
VSASLGEEPRGGSPLRGSFSDLSRLVRFTSPIRLTKTGRLTDVWRPRAPYGKCMWGLFLDEPERRRPAGHCSACEHSEFVHGDRESRRCLYTQCACVGFLVSVAS